MIWSVKIHPDKVNLKFDTPLVLAFTVNRGYAKKLDKIYSQHS